MTVLQKFFKKNKQYFWDFKDVKNVSLEKGTERTLNLGSLNAAKELCKIAGKKKIAKIFFKQISKKRNNYNPKMKNFFQIIFKKYV